MDIKTIVGTWSLEKFEIHPKDGQSKPWGSNVTGLLIYAVSGHMSVSINKDIVPNASSTEKAIYDSTLFYAGTFTVDGNTVRHRVTQATNPSRIGKEMIRFADLEGDLMTLTTPDEDFGKAVIVWNRVK